MRGLTNEELGQVYGAGGCCCPPPPPPCPAPARNGSKQAKNGSNNGYKNGSNKYAKNGSNNYNWG